MECVKYETGWYWKRDRELQKPKNDNEVGPSVTKVESDEGSDIDWDDLEREGSNEDWDEVV